MATRTTPPSGAYSGLGEFMCRVGVMMSSGASLPPIVLMFAHNPTNAYFVAVAVPLLKVLEHVATPLTSMVW